MTRFSLQPAHRRVQILAVFLLLAASGFSRMARAEKPADFATLSVVSDDNYPPYVFRDASGKLRGILPDQWALWEQKTGVKVDLQAMDWAEAQRAGCHINAWRIQRAGMSMQSGVDVAQSM